MNNLIKILAIFAVIVVFFIVFYPYKPIEMEEASNSEIDSLTNQIEVITKNYYDLSIEYNKLIHKQDSVIKEEIIIHETFNDSINSIQYLGIDANIDLFTKLLSADDSIK